MIQNTQKNLQNDNIQYIMIPQTRISPDAGEYISYDIAALDCSTLEIVTVVSDVTTKRRKALRMVESFNRHQLAPCHLRDAITDLIS